ncbi:MAG: hypothetical protein [Bacteriophage sp.]|nr:MAG: hypothetical protein [Bacteriophage sp.]
MAIIVHPFTAGADGKPAYTADQFRRTNTVWLSPVDTTTAAASTGISGIRNEVSGPICSISGSTVTVKDHTGIVYPFKGGAPYTYFVHDETVTLESTTQSYKIALVVTDPSAGIGSTAGATIQALPSTTPDSNINGMVLAQIVQGVVSDVAPRLLSGTIIQTQSLTALQQIKTTDGQKGRIATTGDMYTYLHGSWVAEKSGPTTEGPTVLVENDNVRATGVRYGTVVSLDVYYKRFNTTGGTQLVGQLPAGWWPYWNVNLWFTNPYWSRNFMVHDNGYISYANQHTDNDSLSEHIQFTYICKLV